MKRSYFVVLTAVCLVIILSLPGKAVDLGGEINLNFGLISPVEEDEILTSWDGEAELEFLFPDLDKLKPRLVVKAGINEGDTYTDLKYLYLRRELGDGDITLGRQPVSWAYGSVINPLDYKFAAEGLAGESITASVDGVRYYHSLSGDNSLEAAVDYSSKMYENLEDLDAGFRLRLPGSGYDLSFNGVRQQREIYNQQTATDIEVTLDRIGTTFKTDIGDTGIYGAAGYYILTPEFGDKSEDIVLQLGTDYSFMTEEYGGNRVMLQAEFLRFLKEELDLGLLAGLGSGSGDGTGSIAGGWGLDPTEFLTARDLLVLNLDYERDMFSSVGMAVMAGIEKEAAVFIPYYSEELGDNLELRVEGNLFRDSGGDYTPGAGVTLSHYF
ncbi:MAG: hypothetical protein ACOCZM_03155 [Bacillota bacterium]